MHLFLHANIENRAISGLNSTSFTIEWLPVEIDSINEASIILVTDDPLEPWMSVNLEIVAVASGHNLYCDSFSFLYLILYLIFHTCYYD